MFYIKSFKCSQSVAVICLVLCLFQSNTNAATGIASAHPLATYAGFEIFNKGGNAFDAAVAVSAVLAVVEPASSGLGGGGFWLLHRAEDGFETMLDGREKAPMAAHKNMFLDTSGEVIKGLSKDGILSAGIPGMPAAIVHLSNKYGRLPLAETLAPAIRYARNGFIVGARHLRMLGYRKQLLLQSSAAARIFLHKKEIPALHAMLKQTDLANTLTSIAKSGRAGFYQGKVATQLVDGVQAAGGIWTLEDLAAYKVVEREPIRGEYKGIKFTSAASPSSGGMVLLQTLNILSGYDLDKMASVKRKHIIVEAMRRAYHDRALFMGDADFVDIPLKRLLSQDYAAGKRSSIRPDMALASAYLAGTISEKKGGADTTHFSIIDQQGNRVAATLSINFPFGSGFVAPGTGVLLNDEMDDFVSKAGAMNGYGLVGDVANAIAPQKRMLSSMSPTFLEDSERIAVLGTPGGSRIISMVLLAILDFQAGKQPQSWVSVPRFHHQYLPDAIQYEPQGLTNEEVIGLSALGHRLVEKSYRYGNMQAVQLHKKTHMISAASDPRGEGLALSKN
jgi:gamma-glutamyltranspeptidase/glutathione hydrolase